MLCFISLESIIEDESKLISVDLPISDFKFVVITYKMNNFLKYYSKESLSFKPKPLAIFFSIFTDGFKVPRSILDKSD